MTKRRQALGRSGEDLAVARLQALGYRIIERNYRSRLGEIDLVARDGGRLVFVEIKTRLGPAEEAKAAVDRNKQRRLRRLALSYMKEKGCPEAPCRFDVVAVGLASDRAQVQVIRNAF
ncbi:MAG: YraN family protein [Desulfobacteraceae bacterium]